ncbi:hypothetical protein [Peribacillus butanolivorans]|uniref:hypothetical protein n=1 Tax=Peribacillus butanolivorans TaxID=421767 RepID=UPI0036675E66
MTSKQELAVMNNVVWCGIISKLHGCRIKSGNNLWGLDKKAPTYYPDVITLSNDVCNDEFFNFIEDSQAEFIKDSFSSLKLGDNFELLYEASWIYHKPAIVEDIEKAAYRRIISEEELQCWTSVTGLNGILLPDILFQPDVVVYAKEGDEITAGFIANVSGDTIGVSNVFSSGNAAASIWRDIVHVISQNHVGKHLVGYEQDENLSAAVAAGWENVGYLSVWRKRNL